jgi:hypothetical protein
VPSPPLLKEVQCEPFLRSECLDKLISLGERHHRTAEEDFLGFSYGFVRGIRPMWRAHVRYGRRRPSRS